MDASLPFLSEACLSQSLNPSDLFMNPDDDHLTRIAHTLMCTGLTPRKLAVLLLSAPAPITQSKMYGTGISHAMLSQGSFDLMKTDLVSMTFGTVDRRERFIQATPKGLSLLRRVIQELNACTQEPSGASKCVSRVKRQRTPLNNPLNRLMMTKLNLEVLGELTNLIKVSKTPITGFAMNPRNQSRLMNQINSLGPGSYSGGIYATIIVDPRMSDDNIESFTDSKAWQKRVQEQNEWDHRKLS